jgi:hypothetical protein
MSSLDPRLQNSQRVGGTGRTAAGGGNFEIAKESSDSRLQGLLTDQSHLMMNNMSNDYINSNSLTPKMGDNG